MAMLQHRASRNLGSQNLQSQQRTPANAAASNETIKLIRKLRWIGMEEEAQKLERELSEREEIAADSVVATPRDTD
ncbi:MAG TPA: hypothetical protein VMA30_10155 [Xanthobacteraceae bacterium]|nr:hypothetical protein [Xanthobacteraceae bacterium]